MSIDPKPTGREKRRQPAVLERPWLRIARGRGSRAEHRRQEMSEKDQATHASGKRSAEGASSDDHRISHSRDRTVGEDGSDPQALDTGETGEKKRRPAGR
jgi:hypothetical protein